MVSLNALKAGYMRQGSQLSRVYVIARYLSGATPLPEPMVMYLGDNGRAARVLRQDMR